MAELTEPRVYAVFHPTLSLASQMEFHLRSNPSDQKWRSELPPLPGLPVCYVESLTVSVLKKLMQTIHSTGWASQFRDKYYALRSKSGVIREEYPATEYYKISERSLSQKFHAIELTFNSLRGRIENATAKYRREMTMFVDSRQPCIEFQSDLYLVRAEFASLLFLMRAALDEFAMLLQFLGGPNTDQVSSFSAVMKRAGKQNSHPAIDAAVAEYFEKHCDWFWQMRDVRDYFSHNGFVSLDLVELDGELKIYFNHRLDLVDTAISFKSGLYSLFAFLDSHYAEKIARWR
ncbi:MAG: hypothetical protein ABL985_10650 [Casimicrobium sp.]